MSLNDKPTKGFVFCHGFETGRCLRSQSKFRCNVKEFIFWIWFGQLMENRIPFLGLQAGSAVNTNRMVGLAADVTEYLIVLTLCTSRD